MKYVAKSNYYKTPSTDLSFRLFTAPCWSVFVENRCVATVRRASMAYERIAGARWAATNLAVRVWFGIAVGLRVQV